MKDGNKHEHQSDRLKIAHSYGAFRNDVTQVYGKVWQFCDFLSKGRDAFSSLHLSILFLFCVFSYNGVYFLQLIFGRTLVQYQSAHSFWATFSSTESNFLTLTLCSIKSNKSNFEKYFFNPPFLLFYLPFQKVTLFTQ